MNSSEDPLLDMMDQLVVLPVGIGQTTACDPLGMEVVDEVADLFTQESQPSVLSEILGLTRGEVVWMPEGSVSQVFFSPPAKIVHLPEFTEVGVRFCKPGKSQHRSAKRDTEDSDTFAISQPTVNRQANTYSRAQ